jgi:hypothetical protein
MEKVIREGHVGVLFSPGFGAGFYTWGAPIEAIFNPTLIELVENEKWDEVVSFVEETWGDVYTGGVTDLRVAWIEEGTEFTIEEYDGSESIVFKETIDWITA